MSLISLLEDHAQRGTADLPWIVFKLSRGNISPEMVAHITTAKRGISWVTLQAYIEDPKTVSSIRIAILERKLRNLLGQLEVVEFLKSLDPGIIPEAEEKLSIKKGLADIIVKTSRDIQFPRSYVFSPQTHRIENQPLAIQQGQLIAVKANAWHTFSYSRRSIGQLCEETRQVASKVYTLVVVTKDFMFLSESKQQAVARDVGASGSRLVILEGISACDLAQNTARFLYDLSRK